MIVVVAPYCPVGSGGTPNLGAARKIESVISLLHELDPEVVLVNSGHASQRGQFDKPARVVIGGREVTEVAPPAMRNRRVGKAMQLLLANQAAKNILGRGTPALVWLYNAYAFEMLFARAMSRWTRSPIVLELEDWHFARSRALNPKPYLDWAAWKLVGGRIDYAFVVNQALASKVGRIPHFLFPGIVPPVLVRIATESKPFLNPHVLTVGYFGGLNVEKGADHVLRLAETVPNGVRMVITGAGPLEHRFRQAAQLRPSAVEFLGAVDEAVLYSQIARCDVILNPHSPIDRMSNGVFPFKVIEGIASGRLVISTPLPSDGIEAVLQGVQLVPHSHQAMAVAIAGSRKTYASCRDKVERGAEAAASRFGRAAMLNSIGSIIGRRASSATE